MNPFVHSNRPSPGRGRLLVLGALLWLSAVAGGQEAVPPFINYQGRLLDGSGKEVPTGNYEIAFRLWSAGNGGTLIWGRTVPVSVHSGIFNVVLGDGGSPVPGAEETDIRRAFADRERYLGITITRDHTGAAVSNPQEIVPRQQLLSAPFAMAANDAASLGGLLAARYAQRDDNDSLAAKQVTVTNLTVTGRFEAANTVGGGMVPVGGIIMWAGPSDQVPSGWALCNGQNGTPDLRDRFVLGWGKRDPGSVGGAETHTLTVAQMPSHGHAFRTWHGNFKHAGAASEGSTKNQGQGSFLDNEAVQPSGGGTPFPIMPPFYVLAFIQRIQ